MTGDNLKTMRLVAVFLLGLVLFNYPILSLVDPSKAFMGLPLLFFYLFGVWSLLIALTAWITRSGKKRRQASPPD